MTSIRCAICEVDIEVDEMYFHIDEGLVCETCFRDWVEDYCKSNPDAVADALKVPWKYVSDPHSWDDDRDRRDY